MKVIIAVFLLFVSTKATAAQDFTFQDYADSKKLLEACIANTEHSSADDLQNSCACIIEKMNTHPRLLKQYAKISNTDNGKAILSDVFQTLENSWWSQYMGEVKDRKLTEKESLILSISMNASFACAQESGAIQKID